MRQFLARFSEPESSPQIRSWADFVVTTSEFKFSVHTAEGDQPVMTVRKITDFTVGDRIVAATYEISYLLEGGAEDQLSDMFDDIYLTAEGDNRPVRFQFEEVDSAHLTFVDVYDRPDTDDFYTIEVVGHHQLQFTVAVA